MSPKVSLIMPLYNAEKYVEEAIESILSQTYTNFELILIDDISTDSTMERVLKYKDGRIRIICNSSNQGIAFSRNRGLEMAQGEYIALMDDDDISLPERFAKQVAFLDSHPEIDFVGARYQNIDEDGIVLSEQKTAYHNPSYIRALFLFQNIISNGEMMFRRERVMEKGIRYSDNQYGMEDFKFWIECSKWGNFYTLDDVVFRHRVHKASETTKTKTNLQKERNQHRKHLVRYSMELSNLSLSEDEFDVVYRFTSDELCHSNVELNSYHKALAKLVCQAREQKLEFAEELDILCRKYYMKQIRNVSDFWSLDNR